jgi:mycofactocin precursor
LRRIAPHRVGDDGGPGAPWPGGARAGSLALMDDTTATLDDTVAGDGAEELLEDELLVEEISIDGMCGVY